MAKLLLCHLVAISNLHTGISQSSGTHKEFTKGGQAWYQTGISSTHEVTGGGSGVQSKPPYRILSENQGGQDNVQSHRCVSPAYLMNPKQGSVHNAQKSSVAFQS